MTTTNILSTRWQELIEVDTTTNYDERFRKRLEQKRARLAKLDELEEREYVRYQQQINHQDNPHKRILKRTHSAYIVYEIIKHLIN